MSRQLYMSLLSMEGHELPDASRALDLLRGRKPWDTLTIAESEIGIPYLGMTNHEGHGIVVQCDNNSDVGSFSWLDPPRCRIPL